jgi:drug/metabolite transporter (DMT)-like permease
VASLAVGAARAIVAAIMYYATLLVAVVSVAGYHLSIKAQPAAVNPFLPLAAAYFIAFFVCVAGLFLWSDGSRSLTALRPSVLWLALSVVGIEVGFLLAYRAGWNVGYAALLVNVCSTLVLLPVALLYFKDQLDPQKIAGVVLSLAGLALLLNK